jgi:hypothetical protein
MSNLQAKFQMMEVQYKYLSAGMASLSSCPSVQKEKTTEETDRNLGSKYTCLLFLIFSQ